ncbi:hypothetical protein [Paracoccus fontiphilus]|uniref:Methyltransferase domain-containing protein n=1 Tax=Paracoccus fontiphilus TaxID=1815556 RepID=A0ABV7IIY2_9RHOB|nr:hypothetical protein [Paracoccus fontiphilus]
MIIGIPEPEGRLLHQHAKPAQPGNSADEVGRKSDRDHLKGVRGSPVFGVMFAPDQDRAAAEVLRVCRPGGRIGLANWTPDSFIGEVFRTLGRHLPPPAGLEPPSRWGDRAWIEETFGLARPRPER